jgi:hypothetical protein
MGGISGQYCSAGRRDTASTLGLTATVLSRFANASVGRNKCQTHTHRAQELSDQRQLAQQMGQQVFTIEQL